MRFSLLTYSTCSYWRSFSYSLISFSEFLIPIFRLSRKSGDWTSSSLFLTLWCSLIRFLIALSVFSISFYLVFIFCECGLSASAAPEPSPAPDEGPTPPWPNFFFLRLSWFILSMSMLTFSLIFFNWSLSYLFSALRNFFFLELSVIVSINFGVSFIFSNFTLASARVFSMNLYGFLSSTTF